MSFLNGLYCDHVFHSPLSAADCIKILRDAEPTYGDPLNPSFVETRLLEDSRALLIFKGKRFGKMMRTEYAATLTDEPKGCTVVLTFHKEMFGLPPMTPPQEIALFMHEKLEAIPKNTT